MITTLEPDELAEVFAKLSSLECLQLGAVKTSWRFNPAPGALVELLDRHRERGFLPISAWVRRSAQHIAEAEYPPYALGASLAQVLSLLAEHAKDSPPLAAAAADLLGTLDKTKLAKTDDPKPAALELLRAMPDAAAPVIEAAAKRNVGWAKRLHGQLARLSGQAPRAPEAAEDSLPVELRGKPFPKAPDFWSPAALPQILLHEGEALPATSMDTLAWALSKKHVPTIEAAKAVCTPASLASFAWELFVMWDSAGSPSKHKWGMNALGHFGDDECARQLTPHIRRWPGESQHQRAVSGLDVLATIGSDTAMMCLNGIAQKVRYKGLQKKAREKMDEIAERRGLTKEQLEDRLVPDLGLEDDGSMELDFGPRSFRVGFDETLTPFVFDASGKKRANLPKPGLKDDAELANEAVARFKGMKKDVRTLAKIELARLEQSMGRRDWPAADFEAFLVHHPLMFHVVRRLVWGVVDETGKPTACFRVAEDRTYADIDDEPFELDESATVGLVHRLHMSDDETARWSESFRDYELAAPFPQLDREVYRLGEGDADERAIVRFDRREVETKQLVGLQSRGWRHGTPQDAGVYYCFGKPVRGDLHAWLWFETGIGIGGLDWSDPTQLLGKIEFCREEPWGWGNSSPGAVPVESIDEVTISELLRDVESLPEVVREA